MKKLLFALGLGLITLSGFSQQATESTIKRVSLGYDLYTTLWTNMPTGVNTRAINQGANVFAMYNHDLNENGLSIATGLGISSENLFLKDHYVADIKDVTVEYSAVPAGVNIDRSKLNFTYLDIPIELRLKLKSDVRFGLGFKFGILLDSKTLYKGTGFDSSENIMNYTVKYKDKKINNLEKYRFGIQLRAGYKWVQVFGYYALNKVFIADRGPQMQPIHVGVTFMPF